MSGLIKNLLAVFAWNVIRHTGPWIYQENGITHHRRALRTGYGHQPIDLDWLRRREPIKPIPPGGRKRKNIVPRPPEDSPAYGWSGVQFDLNGEIVI